MGRKYYINPDTGEKIYIRDNVPSLAKYRKAEEQDVIDNEVKSALVTLETASHTHGNKEALDEITEEKIEEWDSKVDVLMISITYSELKTLIDTSSLIKGMQYRITDYDCVVDETVYGIKSAHHVFDIIVTADDNKTINEQARAILHEGDTYFASSKLNEWKIWYSIDGELNYVNTSDSSYRGAITRMIDEFGNDVPYDFKNIQFIRYKLTESESTHTSAFDESLVGMYMATWLMQGNIWGSIYNENDYTIDFNDYIYAYTFTIINDDGSIIDSSIDGLNNYIYSNIINNGKNDLSTVQWKEDEDIWNAPISDIVFFGQYCYFNTFGQGCYSNTFGQYCNSNTFGQYCNSNTFGQSCYFNTFGQYCNSNTFGQYCNSNTFGQGCNSNTFGQGCNSNTFGQWCYFNTFGQSCHSNTFGQGCNFNTFGQSCDCNAFGQSCHSNTFGQGCNFNAFGQSCHSNTFGQWCNSNTFGQYCYSISILSTNYTDRITNFNIMNSVHGDENYPLDILSLRTTDSSYLDEDTKEIKVVGGKMFYIHQTDYYRGGTPFYLVWLDNAWTTLPQ